MLIIGSNNQYKWIIGIDENIGYRKFTLDLLIVNANLSIIYYDGNHDGLKTVWVLDSEGKCWGNPTGWDDVKIRRGGHDPTFLIELPVIVYPSFTEDKLMFIQAVDENGSKRGIPVDLLIDGDGRAHFPSNKASFGTVWIPGRDGTNNGLIFLRNSSDASGPYQLLPWNGNLSFKEVYG